MPNTSLKNALQRELELLAKARDELRVQMHLAKNEAKGEWKRLEDTWQRVETEIRRVGEHAKEPVHDMGGAARSLIDELKRGYARIKAELSPPK